MDAVRAADAEGVALLEGTAFADLAELLHIFDDEVAGLRELVAERGVAKVGGGHTVVDPTAGLRFALRHLGIDVAAHVGEEGDDIVVGHGLDFVDLGLVELGVFADPGGLFLGDATLAELRLSLAGEHLDLLPDGVLVLEREDVTHLGAGISIDHAGSFTWTQGR